MPENSPNQAILDEVNAASGWVYVRKTRSVWARKLDANASVPSSEGMLQAKAGDYVCRGYAGEEWPQSEAGLNKRYVPTEETESGGWRKYIPHPDAEGAMAAQVPHGFKVTAAWGELSGKPGDFILKHASERAVMYPEDVWIVDRAIFEATYQQV